jgi:hypothetical protein
MNVKLTNVCKINIVIFFIACLSCDKGNPNDNIYDGTYIKYYYEEDEYSFRQIKNKIFVQYTSSASTVNWESDREQWEALINSDVSLQPYKNGGVWIILEHKKGSPIPPATIEYYKASSVVASASYLLEAESNGVLHGLTNEFAVKLKETTSYEQLQQLAAQNDCNINTKSFSNQHYVTVSKNSGFDAIQLSGLFCETNLFESVQPKFVIPILPWGGGCDGKIILKTLKDEPGYIRKNCFEHTGRKEAFYLELVNSHPEFFGQSVFPLEEIPKQYRKEGLPVYFSGNVINCTEVGGCIEPYFRLAHIHLVELKSIKINN